MNKCKIPVKPKEFSFVMDAVPKKALILLTNTSQVKDLNLADIKNNIFIGITNIIQNKVSNNYIRNILNNIVNHPAHFFWSSVFGELNWHKVWQTVDTFYINNQEKEVSFKIMHKIYPVKCA